MTTAAPTFSQIKALVADIRKKTNEGVISIRVQGRWTGECRKQDGEEIYLIEQCDSPLAMRIALRENVEERTTKVLITSLDESELGEDILLRLTKQRLFSIDSWQIVKSLFQAHSIDPRLTQYSRLAEYLMDWMPIEGYPPVSGGFLDAETVWSILLSRGIGLTADRPDLLAILKWSSDVENVKRYTEAPTDFRKAVVDWLAPLAGSAVKTVLNGIATNERPDALPIGLALGVVFHPDVGGRLDKAIGKMEERYLGGTSPNESTIARWSVAATEVVRLQLTDRTQKHQLLQRADEILREVGAESFAYLSDTSLIGFEQRLAAFGKRLVEMLDTRTTEALEHLADARRAVQEHDRAKVNHELRRLERVDMAIRLARWLVKEENSELAQPRSLAEAITYHITEGGFVDWARQAIRSGNPVRELSEAYTKLFEQVTEIREKQAYKFATLLRDWTAIGSTRKDVIPVEQILEAVVAPLAAEAPVLVIVMDGMSIAVCRELIADITAGQDWVSLCPEGQVSTLMAGLAAIPSVTEVSRTSLLCGQLRRGNLTNEKKGFALHRELVARCRSSFPPVLFHKSSLQERDTAVLADDVLKAISLSEHRIVGVVVNAVDDHLLKGEQIDTRWSRDEIRILSTLLYEAKVAQRLVILLSDHGHVLDYKTKSRSGEGGERWRFDDGQPGDDELQISGSRVVLPESKALIAPWTERLRYGIKKNGYHGGLTPQEMVVPIAVLCSTDLYPAGWVEAPADIPYWWEEPPNEASETLQFLPQLEVIKQVSYGPLFDLEVEEPIIETQRTTSKQPVFEWVTNLLASPIYQAQKKLAGRSVPPDDVLAKVLVALDSRGGKMTATLLARTINYPVTQIRSLLTMMQRVINIDGYAVLTRDKASDIVELNRDLLRQHFDLVKET